MLVFGDGSNSLSPLEELQHINAKFFLTGSRFFGMATEQADYDFFASHTPELEAELRGRGFSDITPRYLGEQDRVIQEMVCVLHKGRVDVQLVLDAHKKCAIQEALKRSGMLQMLGRTSLPIKYAAWSLAYMAYNASRTSWLIPT